MLGGEKIPRRSGESLKKTDIASNTWMICRYHHKMLEILNFLRLTALLLKFYFVYVGTKSNVLEFYAVLIKKTALNSMQRLL